MTEDGHRQAAAQLRESRARLDRVPDIRLSTEASFGIAHHLTAAGAQRKHGVHREEHQGLSRWLRDRQEAEMAARIDELEQMRIGRWYGRQENGHAADRQDELLVAIAAWSVA